jgi:Xaa-Pro aminopeptidase
LAIAQRLERLRQQLAEKSLNAILLTQPENCRYISGFTGSSGPTATLLISQESAVLATDFIHFEQAKQEAPDFDVITVTNSSQRFTQLLSSNGKPEKVGFEANVLSVAEFRRLSEEAEKARVDLVPTEEILDCLRAVKDEEEISCILRAAFIADTAIDFIASEIHSGMTEKGVAWEIEKYIRENGSEPIPFDIIVASGPNAALPHAKPTDRPISDSEPIILDIGARWKGYCSDLSRTLCLGQLSERFQAIYDVVLRAQLSALDGIETGMTGVQADGIARGVIDQAGYKNAFGHGLGHGVGLAVHERPRVSPVSTDVIQENMVLTVEPAIYITGWGGVRIEDTIVMRNGKVQPLTKASKNAKPAEVS